MSNQHSDTLWNRYPQAAARLRHLWVTDRVHLSAIAKVLTAEYGQPVTRNSVLGKIKRLGLLGSGGLYTKPNGGRVVAHSSKVQGVSLAGGYRYDRGRVTAENRV